MLCPKCNSQMNNTMHFESGKKYQYHECSKCHEQTKHKRLHFEDIFQNELKKIKTS